MLKKKTALIVLTIILLLALVSVSALALVFTPTDGNGIFSSNGSDADASAAITAATSFGKLTHGSQYWYTNTGATAAPTAVTVNSGSAHGSAANPYVISTEEQWVFFANVITNQTAGYTGTAKGVLQLSGL